MKLGERPVIFLGQYEAISKHYMFTKKIWNHRCKFQIVLKDKGYSNIILDFKSQEFGFGYPLKIPDLKTINDYHAIHYKYVDTDSSTIILEHTNKEPIIIGINYFCQEFQYVTSGVVYWTYGWMVLQLEDCTDM